MPTIVSFEDFKVALDLNKASFADYPALEQTANSVHDSLENHVGRSLSLIAKSSESGFNINPSSDIDIYNLPITSITSVKINGVETTTYSENAYGISLDIDFVGKWEVVTKGGFKVIPADIYRAELIQSVYEYQNRNNLSSKSYNNKGGSTTTDGLVILADVKRLLERYYHVSKLGF